MFTRRDLLIRAATVGAATLLRPVLPVFAKASQPSTPVNFTVPAGACDCHVHVFDPQRFPFAPSRTYTPEPATIEELQSLHRALHTGRVVIVQPSVYRTDNACTLDAIRRIGTSARGIAVIDDNTTEAALDEMHHAGIRGIRINLLSAMQQTTNQLDPVKVRQRLHAAIERIRQRKWHIQIYAKIAVIESIKEQVLASPVPIVFDHFGGAQASLGIEQPGFKSLLSMVQAGKAYVKISAPYRSSTQGPDYPDVAPLAKALIAANPQRILWGTDWPHPDSAPVDGRKATDLAQLFPIDDGRVFNLLASWTSDAALRKTILVKNPAKLYGF